MAIQNATNGKAIVSSADRILGRVTAGAGVSEEITCTAAGRSLLSGTDVAAIRATLALGTLATLNTVPVANGGTGLTAIGAANQVLRVNSGGTALEFATPSGGADGIRLPYIETTSTAQAANVDTAYGLNNAALCILTLPVTAAVGTCIEVNGIGAGGFRVAQNAGQNIQFGSITSAVGVTGQINSTNRFDSIGIRCITANTTWCVYQSIGNLDVI